jgi:hypothetical protein
MVERRGGQIIQALEGDRIVLDGQAWVVEGAPAIECVELLLCA